MPIRRTYCVFAALALLLSGCSYTDGLFGSSSPGPAAQGTTIPIAPSAAEANPQPTVAAHPSSGKAASAAPTTTTFVGEKVAELRRDVQRLEDNLNRHHQDLGQTEQVMQQDAATYFGLIASINSRLQVGTTPGNPQLVAQWNQAQTALDRMSDDIARLNTVSNQTAADASFASYLLDATRAAFSLQGAVEQDHRDLKQLETEITAATAQIDTLLNTLSNEIGRQSGYIGNERANLVTLSLAIKNGQLYGPSLANRAFVGSAPQAPVAHSSARSSARDEHRQPLVVIRFDRPNVSYDEALYSAVSRALQREPSARFDVVAIAPNAGNAAQVAVSANASKRNAENVMRSLTSMGLPPDRITLSASSSAGVKNNEVRVYVR
jgi:hypothetical protein